MSIMTYNLFLRVKVYSIQLPQNDLNYNEKFIHLPAPFCMKMFKILRA